MAVDTIAALRQIAALAMLTRLDGTLSARNTAGIIVMDALNAVAVNAGNPAPYTEEERERAAWEATTRGKSRPGYR